MIACLLFLRKIKNRYFRFPTKVSLKMREAAETKKEVELDLTPSTPVNGRDPPPDLVCTLS